MLKKKQWIAAALCLSLVFGGCAAGGNEDKEEKPSEQTEEQETPKKPAYQAKLDVIEPAAYGNAEGLKLEKGSYISIIGKGEEGQYWKQVKKGVDRAAKDLNVQLGYEGKDKIKVVYSAPAETDNVDEQVNLLDEELSRYPVALGIAIVDENACDVQFDLAADSEIPIVAFDSGSDYQGLMATVSTNNSESAQVVADNLGKELEGTGEIVVVANDSKSKNNKERVNAFAAKLQESYPEISIVDTVYLDALDSWQEQIAAEINAGTYALSGEPTGTALSEETQVDPKSITEEQVLDYVLKKHPNLKGVYGTNQVAVKALVEGIERGEREGLKVVGYDADEEQLQMLKDGTVDGLVVQNPFGMGYASVIAAARAAIGAGNEAYVNTGYVWVTKDNMKKEEVKQMLAE